MTEAEMQSLLDRNFTSDADKLQLATLDIAVVRQIARNRDIPTSVMTRSSEAAMSKKELKTAISNADRSLVPI